MSTQIYFSSNKLGEVNGEQLQSVLDRFDLGRLISFCRTDQGAMGQTLLVSSSAGEFVLKGNPLFPGQFLEERYFIQYLDQHTDLPVPSPYLVDEGDDIFGWSYSLMPRLPGSHLFSPELEAELNPQDESDIAVLFADTLLQLHRWKVEQPGEFDPATGNVRPFHDSYTTWLFDTITYWLDDAKRYSKITAEDTVWVEELLKESKEAFDDLKYPCFVMGDFKPGNLLLQQSTNSWKVSGLFDFTTSYFGDGIADLPKMTALYLENGKEGTARKFLQAYKAGLQSCDQDVFEKRFKVHMLYQRILFWGCAQATNTVTWDTHLSFSAWARPFTEAASEL
ncbi:aminoglycoside phosphotransferase family protein [Paenibacillus sp. N3/727]|uniref:phosphotransferase family protein n=1 Tax=Paenibacillus sp. N3/727 TaxID=2925845 RepID=UPI001F532765|nr:aminoglycoside phosphotransferase family protein [Paenibacillus sp. N3/727]UNK19048.1 aminoglycoside phosphotransferase family protein [Paenibacillus sp. N3/727]